MIFELVRASTLASDFRDRRFGDAIYDAAVAAFGQQAYLLHQRGIYEMRLAEERDAFDLAEQCLQKALELMPNNAAFQHSLSELALRRAGAASAEQERAAWRNKADNIATALAKSGSTSHAHHTLVKSAVGAVRDALAKAETSDSDLANEAFSEAVKIAEERLRSALQRFPNESYLLTAEAELSVILKNADRALKALCKAFEKNQKSELVALRYARVLLAQENTSSAIDVLRRGLERNPGSQALNYALAQALRRSAPDADAKQSDLLLYHFQRSFSKDDKNYEAQFWFARQLCLSGKQLDAKPIFESLKKIHLPFSQKRSPRGYILDASGAEAGLYGVVYRLGQSYGFIRADLASMEVYFEFSKENSLLEALEVNDRVSFNIAFSLAGPCALNVQPV